MLTMQSRIPILVYSDLESAYGHLTQVFGLGEGELARDEDGVAVHGEVRVGDEVIWLHQESEEYRLSSPQTLDAATGMITLFVEDVDSHFAGARELGADIVYEPVDQPYGYREYGARGPEGHLWSFMTPLD